MTVGPGCLLPPLSSDGARVPKPWFRFHTPLIEPDVQISRIRLSDKTPRHKTCDAICGCWRQLGVKRFPNLRSFATYCTCLELRLLPSTGITRLPRYYGPLRHPAAPGLSVTGIRLAVADHAAGLPVLRALSLCTCCRHYPGTATGGTLCSNPPAVAAFPARVSGSACASSVSRIARRSLALRPAHSRCHRNL